RFSRDWSSDVCSSDLTDAALGTLEQLGDLDFRQPAEVAQLDHLGQAQVDRGQAGQRDVQGEHVVIQAQATLHVLGQVGDPVQVRSEERRVGEESGARG